jgi:molybdopterin-guanine dinucleotide biosynthesis protein A
MDAIVTAGGIPQPDDLLYPFTQGKPKALVDINGKPMVQWVLDAVGAAKNVENIVLIGLAEESGLSCTKPLYFVPNQDSMITNIIAGLRKVLEINPTSARALLVSSDIPGITPEMVDWEVETTLQSDVDLCYNLVRREVLEARYPGSKRTYTRLKNLQVCTGDMNVLRTSVVSANPEIWEKLVAVRKSPIKQAAIIGFDTLIFALLGIITVDKAVEMATKRLHMSGMAVICPYAEVGMDVDKPVQLEMMRADLAKRGKL